MRITFESDTALGLVQQMQQYIQDTSVGAVISTTLNHSQIVGLPANAVSAVNNGTTVTVEQPETPNANPPALDVNGFPWDARIHSGGKTLTDGGAWRYKKGVDKTVIQQVEAELSARLNGQQQVTAQAPVVQSAPVPAAPPAAPVNTAGFTETVQTTPAPVAPPAAVVPAPVSAPVQPQPAPAAPTGTLSGADIIQLIGTKKLDVPSQVKPLLTQFGLTDLPQVFLPANAPMLATIYNAIDALG